MKNNTTQVIKASGRIEPFSIDKLKSSLKKSGADDSIIDEIATEIQAQLYEGMTTRKIYQLAYKMLNKKRKPVAAKYSIKNAIMQLGPSGFPFEKYISLLLAQLGYKVKINQFLAGACVTHEVDIIMENDRNICIVECKYHNLAGTVCDIKVPLYVASRFKDITANMTDKATIYECWIVTNTNFSSDAVKYGVCTGQHLISWNHPPENNLKTLIDRYKLYPVSCLTSLTKREKQILLEQGIILCKDLISNSDALANNHIGGPRIANIINEAMNLASI